MQVELTMPNRFTLMNVLPVQDSITNIRIITDLKHELAPDDGDIKEYGIVEDKITNRIQFDPSNKKKKKIEIGDAVMGLIVVALKKLDSEKKLSEAHIELYSMFVEGPTNPKEPNK